MKFKTLEDYDNYLSGIQKDLDEMAEYLKEHPEKLGTRGNYETLKDFHEIFANNRLEFIQELSEINLKLDRNKALSLNNLY